VNFYGRIKIASSLFYTPKPSSTSGAFFGHRNEVKEVEKALAKMRSETRNDSNFK